MMVAGGDSFTEEQYRELIKLAKKKYPFVGYEKLDFSTRFIVWRHDVDLSLNRAESLAKIEVEEGVRSTFFINPHCEFYNLLEKSQTDIVKRLIAMGHDIGLHFDSEFYEIHNENKLEELVEFEADWLGKWLNYKISVFSFHNPTPLLLSFDKESYGGLVNCYSKNFKTKTDYCSDSNGRWRHRNLFEVLKEAKEDRLQVLTHPGWWQKRASTAKRKVQRCVYGRAEATLDIHEHSILKNGRYEDG